MLFDHYKRSVADINKSDYSALLNIGRKWKNIENHSYNVKIAFLGSASIQLVASVTRALLTRYDIYANVYEGEFNGILMDTMDENSELYQFAPDCIVILPDYHDIIEHKPTILSGKREIERVVVKTRDDYLKIFERIHAKLSRCQVFMSNFVSPFWGNLGNLEANYLFSQKSYFELVNLSLAENRPSYVSILDMDSLAGYIGKGQWFDESSYFLNKCGFNITYIGYVSDLIARQFEAYMGKVHKCLVLDLDHTLWGGAVGDLGYDGIMLDPNDAEGEAFRAFQQYVLGLKQRGVILAVCSKNDIENAKAPFEKNENMILHLEDISCFAANWNDKVSNLKFISQELNIGVESLVFFDDNPTERALIKEFLPEVRVVEVPEDPALFIRALDQTYAFEWNQVTQEDIRRVKSYSDNIERNDLLESCVNYEEYLKKLEMHIKLSGVDESSLARFSQLTNKSNQFNLRTQRYSEAEIVRMLTDDSYKLLAVSLRDKFSNYGIIACVVLKFEEKICHIDNWVMSCRVLKKSVENYTAQKIVEEAKKHGALCIKAEYLKSKKNRMVADLYENLGFTKTDSNEETAHYILNLVYMDEYKQSYYFEED